jgi:LPXTG-site transpeptidase (sortase) family protein
MPRHRRVLRTSVAVATLGLVSTAAAAGASLWSGQTAQDGASRVDDTRSVGTLRPAPEPSGSPDRTPEADTPDKAVGSGGAREATAPGRPRRMVIPRLGVDAPVVPKNAEGGTFEAPDDANVLGWWAAGAQPGEERGSVLVAGHTLRGQRGALHDLEETRVGDPVTVATGGSVVRYRVRTVEVLTKEQVAARATELFDQDAPGRLVVVTCEIWNGRRFTGNVILTADKVRVVPRADL